MLCVDWELSEYVLILCMFDRALVLFPFLLFTRINRFFELLYLYRKCTQQLLANSIQHFHQPLSGPVSEFLRAIQLVLPNFSFFLSLAFFFSTTNFFSRGDDFQKKSCIKKLNYHTKRRFATNTLAHAIRRYAYHHYSSSESRRSVAVAVRHYTRGLGLNSVHTLRRRDFAPWLFLFTRSFAAGSPRRRLLPAPAAINLFRNFRQTSTN